MAGGAALRVGTSGFQYDEWKGSFYPEKLAAKKMLSFYAERFSTVEINYSFRRVPSVSTLEGWSAQTPEGFRFALKAPQGITHHERLGPGSADLADSFCRTVRTLGGKLGPLLFQLPPFFQKDAGRLAEFLKLLPRDLPCAFEFRHDSWFDAEVLAILRGAGAALCVAEHEDGKATPAEVTARFAYVRLRRPDYEAADLARWADTLRGWLERGVDVFCYFKHEEQGIGPKLAASLVELSGARPGVT